MVVSVIIPFYKEIELIKRAVDSVFSQSFLPKEVNIELIIGNDGDFSHSEILAAIGSSADDPTISIIDNEGVKGPGGARNCAIRASRGDYLAFLDSDDMWLDGKLAAQIKLVESGADFIATGYQMDDSPTVIRPPEPRERGLDVFRDLGILTSSVMVRASLVKSTMFRDLRFSQDIDLWFRIFQIPQVEYQCLREAYVRYSTVGSTRNKLEQAGSVWHVMTINRVSLTQKMVCMILYASRGLRNHILRL